MAKIAAILDNGPRKRANCIDCAASIRYEYYTDEGGPYGSKCIHRHIHECPDWMTFKAAADARAFNARLAGFQRQYAVAREQETIKYTEFSDGSCRISGITQYDEEGTDWVIEQLIADGWQREKIGVPTFAGRCFHSRTWQLIHP